MHNPLIPSDYNVILYCLFACLFVSSLSPKGTRRAAAAMVTTIPLAASIAEENHHDDDEEENDEGGNNHKKGLTKAAEKKKSSTKKGDKKDKFEFDFSGPWVSEDLFAVPAANKRGERVTPTLSYAIIPLHSPPLPPANSPLSLIHCE